MKIMKRKLNLSVCITFVLMLIVISFSCSTDDEQLYSCDKKINEWVKGNIPTIRKMNRTQWLQCKSSQSLAIYKAFAPTQKMLFWKEKFKELQELSWTREELSHILKVLKYVNTHPYIFSDDSLTEEQEDELELFFYDWQNMAITELGWTKVLCVAIAGTGYKLKNKDGEIDLQFSDTVISGPSSPQKDCNCNTSILSDFCNVTLSGTCVKTKCNSEKGCGWLMLQTCNGECDAFV